jgi:hypothetical protein
MTRISLQHQALLALSMIAMGNFVWAQDSGKPAVTSNFQRVEATVQAIDQATRQMTLSGPKGTVSFTVDPGVRNLNNVHVGDKVVVSYYESIATQMVKGGTTVQEPATSTFTSPSTDSTRPGGRWGRSVTSTVRIEAVNTADNTVAFKGPDGQLRVVTVRSPNMQQFLRTLAPGDSVQVTYTRSVAVNVEPASPSHVAEGK